MKCSQFKQYTEATFVENDMIMVPLHQNKWSEQYNGFLKWQFIEHLASHLTILEKNL